MKKVIFEKYKTINIILCLAVGALALGIHFFISLGYCMDICSLELKRGIINPIYFGGKWLFLILAVLALLPVRIFKKWFFFILPPSLIIISVSVANVSVYSSGFFSSTRSSKTETGMIILALITALFVLGHLVYDVTKWAANKKKV